MLMQGWGRYSGYFFYWYPLNPKSSAYPKKLYGPYDTRQSAEDAAFGKNHGKIFQKEKPVNFNSWTGRGY